MFFVVGIEIFRQLYALYWVFLLIELLENVCEFLSNELVGDDFSCFCVSVDIAMEYFYVAKMVALYVWVWLVAFSLHLLPDLFGYGLGSEEVPLGDVFGSEE